MPELKRFTFFSKRENFSPKPRNHLVLPRSDPWFARDLTVTRNNYFSSLTICVGVAVKVRNPKKKTKKGKKTILLKNEFQPPAA
jgi:hypothetical protein